MKTNLLVSKIASFLTVFAMILSTVFVPTSITKYVSADHDPFNGEPQTSVLICHSAGRSGKYVSNSPNVTATGGKIDITGHASDPDDIIPPFHFDDNGTILSYPGQNWSLINEDIWASGDCTGDGVIDPVNTPPVLEGNDEDGVMTINEGADFTDPGAVCTDAEDNPEPAVATGGDAVNTNTPGEYVITYNCTDSDGATAPEVTLTVTVVDMPECSDIEDNSDIEDQLADSQDPGCWEDPNDSESYDPEDNDETDPTDVCNNIAGFQLTLPEGNYFASAGICSPIILGCTNPGATNYNPSATSGNANAEQCTFPVTGCTDPVAINYNPNATEGNVDAQNCMYHVLGCTNPDANNYNQSATLGNPNAEQCTFNVLGCTDPEANNYDDNANVDDGSCTYDELSCDAQTFTGTSVASSDVTTMVGENPSVLLTTINAGWTAMIDDASWIWSTNPVVLVADPATETEVFTKTFNVDKVNQTVTGANLTIAADNTYSVTLNGDLLCSDNAENNFSLAGQDNCVISANALLNGSNTLVITVTNGAHGNSAVSNPAGLMYKLTVDGNKCVPDQEEEDQVDLSITKVASDETPMVGGQVTYTINVFNNGPDSATNVVVTDFIPASTTFVSANPAPVDVNVSPLEWNFASIPSGLGVEIEVTVTINSETEGQKIVNTAEASSDETDTNTENNLVNEDVVVEEGGEQDQPECSDGVDNDGDGQIDYGDDAGCDSDNDDDESNESSSSSGSRRSSGGGQVLGAATDVCNWTTQYARNKWNGNVPDNVQTMQNFLNLHMNAGLAVDSIFGPKTEAAVSAFQTKYIADILTPWGINRPTGIWYISTTTKAKEIMCGEKPPLPALINWSKNPEVAR